LFMHNCEVVTFHKMNVRDRGLWLLYVKKGHISLICMRECVCVRVCVCVCARHLLCNKQLHSSARTQKQKRQRKEVCSYLCTFLETLCMHDDLHAHTHMCTYITALFLQTLCMHDGLHAHTHMCTYNSCVLRGKRRRRRVLDRSGWQWLKLKER